MEPEPEAEPEPSPGAGALIKSEAPKKAPDGPKMGGSGEKAPAPEHREKL